MQVARRPVSEESTFRISWSFVGRIPALTVGHIYAYFNDEFLPAELVLYEGFNRNRLYL